MTVKELSEEEKVRYKRHLNIPEIGESGQLKLKNASVLVIGAGGLGSASSLYLAAAGVGKIGIIDSDVVELSNLQRQILHETSKIGSSKVDSARDRIVALNPNVDIKTYQLRVTDGMDETIFEEFPIIIDATDNFATRYFLNQICVQKGKVFIYGAVYQFYGQMSVFDASRGPCFQCIFKDEPSDEYTKANQGSGILGAVPGVIGNLQAIEAIKQILEKGDTLINRLLLFDGLEMRFQEIVTKRDPTCSICGGGKK
jgi:molybdopterin/thiamine biosynthesis adenylyltransferase